MKIDEKAEDEALAAYKLAAAELRAKIVAENRVIVDEVLPVNGVINLSLGEPLSKERRAKIPMRVQPLIDIPEVRQYSTKSE